jgi:hypothetical protein
MDFRETWTEASGMLTTVGSLIYVQDKDGNATGVVMDEENLTENLKVHAGKNVIMKMGEKVWRLESDHDTTIDALYVIPNLSQVIGSFISQTASDVVLGVANESGLIAQISANITGNESFINLISTKVQISGDLIASSLSTTKADIGGIFIGESAITCSVGGNETFKIDGKEGVVYANDIVIKGGKLFGNNVEEDKLIFKDKDGNTVLYIGSVDKNEGEEKDPVICGGFKDKKMFVSKFTYTDNIPSQSVYATFIQPPSFADIFFGVNKIEIPNHGIFHKGNGIILCHDTNNKIKYCEEKDKYSIGLLELSNGSKELCVIQEITSSGWKNYKVFKKIRGEETCEINVDDFASIEDKIDFADLLIYDDGSIESDYVTFNNGLFKGEIDSDGIFKGNLNEVNGSINNVTIENSIINNSLYVDKVLNVNNDSENIFNTQYFSDFYSFYDQNKTKKIVTFSNSNEIVLFEKQNDNENEEGVKVEIEEISGFIHRFIPFNREADIASVTVTISGLTEIVSGACTNGVYKYNNDSGVGIFTYTQPKLSSRGKHRQNFNTTKITGTLPKSKSLKITLSYNIPAARKYGASYGSAWVSVNKMRIFFDADSKGLSVNKQGFLYNSPKGKNGIKVTDEGIFFYLDNKEYNLKTLIGDLNSVKAFVEKFQ